MKKTRILTQYFTKGELFLWIGSALIIVAFFVLFDRSNFLTLFASLVGVTSLLISWMRNPYNGNKAEVKINHLSKKELVVMWLTSAIVTLLFYFILKYFNTANIVPSTISVITSFVVVYLTFRRSPLFALGYAANDIVLIILWSLAMREDISYISVVVCFMAFLINDIYGFINWKRMGKRQAENL
ncbi:MAG: nicotinamide mononucleotide transporter family protein [Bacilli bacterium]